MSFNNFEVIVLAAGKGTRMKSEMPKVLHSFNKIPMLHYVLNVVDEISPIKINIIVGYKKDEVIDSVHEWQNLTKSQIPVEFITQEQQLGTGHAVLCAEKFIDRSADILVLLGDVPLIQKESLTQAREALFIDNTAAVVLTTELDEPYGYGRIVRNISNEFESIKEQKETNDSEAAIKEVNTGIFIFRGKILWDHIHKLQANHDNGELYLTDLVYLIRKSNHDVIGLKMQDHQQFIGINSSQQLLEAEKNQQRYLLIR